MCTVIVLIRPGHAWPVVVAANRDEMEARAWDMPAAYWPDLPGVAAGRDRTAGGTWMGVGRDGVMAAVLNRPGSLGPAAGKRSRGELPLMALRHADAAAAAEALAALDAAPWRGFNMVVADRRGAFFVRGVGHGRVAVQALPPGLSMVTAHDPNDMDSPRVARHLPRFRAARAPEPGDWGDWPALLADRAGDAGEQLNVRPRGLTSNGWSDSGFATVCSSLVALPAAGGAEWLFAPGPPHAAAFAPLALP
jgi:hypothetical protein